MVLVSFLLPGAIAGLTIRHEDQSADKEREREKQEDEWWNAATPFYCTRLSRSQMENGTCARRVSRNNTPEVRSVECRLREEHASQEEGGYLTSIHYFLQGCNFYGVLLFTNIAFL
jgi:hypothetical protein